MGRRTGRSSPLRRRSALPDSQHRHLIHFDDGGSGMRHRDEPLAVGDELSDGGVDYVIDRVEPAPGAMSFGHAWAVRRRRMTCAG
jgi:hypothetical protein